MGLLGCDQDRCESLLIPAVDRVFEIAHLMRVTNDEAVQDQQVGGHHPRQGLPRDARCDLVLHPRVLRKVLWCLPKLLEFDLDEV